MPTCVVKIELILESAKLWELLKAVLRTGIGCSPWTPSLFFTGKLDTQFARKLFKTIHLDSSLVLFLCFTLSNCS